MRPLPDQRTRAQQSRSAIERLYISMRHLITRGSYKPLGVSGEAMIKALMELRPEIYGSISDPERVELDGLFYIVQRLPMGIEECRYIKFISREGFEDSQFTPIIPSKRRRRAYRIDQEQMFIEMTRGRSDIYDILTHLTFMFVEAEKIRRNSEDSKGRKLRDWYQLEEIVRLEGEGEPFHLEVAYTYLSTLLGRTYQETVAACRRFASDPEVNSIFRITYWLGRQSTEEALEGKDREIFFSSALREQIGHHYYGEVWAGHLKSRMEQLQLLDRPIHIISANLHSVMNTFFAAKALKNKRKGSFLELMEELSRDDRQAWRDQVKAYALKNGMHHIADRSGTNIAVQLFDTAAIPMDALPDTLHLDTTYIREEKPLLLVMDYAFGEQAYETMDELLRPYPGPDGPRNLRVESIAIMGKAGILEGGKGDIMVPTAHIFEGTADNYPFANELRAADFHGCGFGVLEGPMITVLGTSLQNKEILSFFRHSSWRAIGLEMEGAHYQKAIQAASRIRNSIKRNVALYYAYYASDNPLITGHTLASGSLGLDGVKPTYLITHTILRKALRAR